MNDRNQRLETKEQRDAYSSPWTLATRLKGGMWSIVWCVLFRPTPKPLSPWRVLLLRLFGAILVFAAFGLMLKPLEVVADVVPIIGDIVGFGAGIAALDERPRKPVAEIDLSRHRRAVRFRSGLADLRLTCTVHHSSLKIIRHGMRADRCTRVNALPAIISQSRNCHPCKNA